MRNSDPGRRNKSLYPSGYAGDGLDPVVYDIGLAAALHFLKNGFLNDAFICMRYKSLNRLSVKGRRLYQADIARAHKRKIESARYGGCG